MAEISGAALFAKALKTQGVQHMFGMPGIPMIPIGPAVQAEDIHYYAMHHEMPATAAAQATGYLTRRPGVIVAAAGPAVLNATGAFASAWSNRWPMILLGGSFESHKGGMGDFQEADQVTPMKPFAKWAFRMEHVERIPLYIAEAFRRAMYGTPGPVYLDVPGDFVGAKVDESAVQWGEYVPDPEGVPSSPQSVERALEVLKGAEQPLIVIGKGVAYGRAEHEMRRFVEATGIPYLAMPMARGVIPDDHPQSAAAARSTVLQNADVIFLAAARLNWMLHFGLPPRFRPDVKFVQLDSNADEIGVNRPAAAALTGDAKLTLGQLLDALDREPWQFPQDSEWLQSVRAEARSNAETVKGMRGRDGDPLGYYTVYSEMKDLLPRDTMYVAEGASTMDISRSVIDHDLPRHRLDAATFASMGLGHGFAIAAQIHSPGKRVVALQGDSAFGFGAMECEVAVRYGLPITWIVMNNGGIGGSPKAAFKGKHLPPNALTPDIRYDRLMEAFGGKGYHVDSVESLRSALADAMTLTDRPSLLNVVIDAASKRKPQKFGWLTH